MTTAVITKDLASAEFVHKMLADRGEKATLIATANQRLVDGTLIIPSYLAKGLEFDAVIMWGASKENYHRVDETQLVYTITSRAMYKLDIIYTGERVHYSMQTRVPTKKNNWQINFVVYYLNQY